ncbi:MAG: serine dehydratase subunit alpha family protein [Firmicutes bacterium]|nr:serine dehydratase subunit alpha family protein [Bacillota bacterium]
MKKHELVYDTCVQLLETELVPAMGCTEPIAVAYCAAKAKELLGETPEIVDVKVSGNIIKNVKSVVVPNTDGMAGMEVAAAAGIAFGKPEKELECIAQATPEDKENMRRLLKEAEFTVSPTYGTEILEIIITLKANGHSSLARIIKRHANIVRLEKDGEVLYDKTDDAEDGAAKGPDKSLLTIKGSYEFAKTCDLADVEGPIRRQIACNSAISKAGLTEDWGANVGKSILEFKGDSLRNRAIAAAAAGSDARMGGCELPVVIVSGSGNQGITASMPVITYAKELGKSEEELIRAIVFSDLVALQEKAGVGALSAFCGAMCAASGAGAGIAFLQGASEEDIEKVIITSLGQISGMLCDGAKASCATKIAAAVDCSIFAWEMLGKGRRLKGGDGILSDDVEKCIADVGRVARVGMAETDHVVQAIMTE